MKVFFVGSEIDGCYNVRCLFPLQANGWDGNRTTLIAYRMTPEDKARAAQDADIVVFHRPEREGKLEMMRLLKKHGKKVVFDNDDTYKDDGGFKFSEYMNKERLERGLDKLNDVIDKCIKEADLVTCSTSFLKEEYSKINPNVVVLPNYIDPFYFPEPLRNETDTVRIVITGSLAITSDIEVLKPIIEHYQNDPRVQIVVLSLPPIGEDKTVRQLYFDEYNFWESVNIEWHPFVPADEYYEALNDLKCDFAIIPRADNLFNRCKSNLKFLENSMLEIPSICQSFPTKDSPYEQNPEDKDHMLLATDYASWIFQIEQLITNKERRRELGRKAREYVEANYDINDEKNHKKWYNAYAKLLAIKN